MLRVSGFVVGTVGCIIHIFWGSQRINVQETFKLDDSAKAQLDKVQAGDKVDIEVVSRNGEKIAKSLMKAS